MHGLARSQSALLDHCSRENAQASVQGTQAGWRQCCCLGTGCFECREGALEVDNLLIHDGHARGEHGLRGKMLFCPVRGDQIDRRGERGKGKEREGGRRQCTRI